MLPQNIHRKRKVSDPKFPCPPPVINIEANKRIGLKSVQNIVKANFLIIENQTNIFPGFKMPFGSNTFLMFFIISSVGASIAIPRYAALT